MSAGTNFCAAADADYPIPGFRCASQCNTCRDHIEGLAREHVAAERAAKAFAADPLSEESRWQFQHDLQCAFAPQSPIPNPQSREQR